jgi:hypothetical protein
MFFSVVEENVMKVKTNVKAGAGKADLVDGI